MFYKSIKMDGALIGIFGTLLGVFVGGYIENIVTWKIKDKIDNVDLMYKNIYTIRNQVTQFIKDNKDNKDDKVQLLLADYDVLLGEMSLKNEILDKQFESGCRKIMNCLFEISDTGGVRKYQDKYRQLYDYTDEICLNLISYRKKITSFKYMLKELFCE